MTKDQFHIEMEDISMYPLERSTDYYIWEEVFVCVYHGHLSFVDAYNLPIHRRKWWIKKIQKPCD